MALQIHAARIHTRVELTTQTLKQGAEITLVHLIVGVYPEANGVSLGANGARRRPRTSGWNHGTVPVLPRSQTAVGIGLAGSRTAEAWSSGSTV